MTEGQKNWQKEQKIEQKFAGWSYHSQIFFVALGGDMADRTPYLLTLMLALFAGAAHGFSGISPSRCMPLRCVLIFIVGVSVITMPHLMNTFSR